MPADSKLGNGAVNTFPRQRNKHSAAEEQMEEVFSVGPLTFDNILIWIYEA
jgi:hypothetical protein